MNSNFKIDPKLDLVFERTTSVPVEQMWKCWTDPKTLMQWFCPKPWKVTECRIELIPGGEFYTLMQGPGGETVPNHGCYLELVENQRLVFTNTMTQGFRPQAQGHLGFPFVVIATFTKTEKGTLYKAIVRHADESGRAEHEKMGFQEGWGLAFDQLVELMK